jgi:hypothetical protein
MCYAIIDPPDFATTETNRFVAAVKQRAGERLKCDLVADVKLGWGAPINVRRNLTARRQLSDDATAKLNAVDAVD